MLVVINEYSAVLFCFFATLYYYVIIQRQCRTTTLNLIATRYLLFKYLVVDQLKRMG